MPKRADSEVTELRLAIKHLLKCEERNQRQVPISPAPWRRLLQRAQRRIEELEAHLSRFIA